MKSKLISLSIAVAIGCTSLFSMAKPASAMTAEDICYKNAYDATISVLEFNLNNDWEIFSLQNLIKDSRNKIKRLTPNSQAIPIFSQLVDKRQQEIFIALDKYLDTLTPEKDSYILYDQYVLENIRETINVISKVCPNYPSILVEKLNKLQNAKIDKATEAFNLFKATSSFDTLKIASSAIYDLNHINEDHPKKAYVTTLVKDFNELKQTFYSSNNSEYVAVLKENLKSILDNPKLKETLMKYFNEETVNKIMDSSESMKKFIDENDGEALYNLINHIESANKYNK